ncbi:MAG: EAL domain-containing protein, partial [Beijerinckiaceae bacterium]
ELEITESLLLDDDNGTLDKMRQIRDLGVRISLDDFGTGYSSLSYIHRFPFSKLKIDQSFVRNIGESASCEPILSAIVNLSLTLAVDTIAEGIETAEQMACLKRLGCGEIQGYLISRPVPAAELEALIDGDARKRVA